MSFWKRLYATYQFYRLLGLSEEIKKVIPGPDPNGQIKGVIYQLIAVMREQPNWLTIPAVVELWIGMSETIEEYMA